MDEETQWKMIVAAMFAAYDSAASAFRQNQSADNYTTLHDAALALQYVSRPDTLTKYQIANTLKDIGVGHWVSYIAKTVRNIMKEYSINAETRIVEASAPVPTKPAAAAHVKKRST